ncbi:hypothetical protein [Methylobacterium goesingense]|uniref:Uncharacterized protein n=1 Tax=Methylobacterium goesingense TaxID=243690 RepID=A0ABV2LAH9_9HYPH|nr:hypothetical protein [Methylobacterium goesingense]GJD73646.1 hypothetical protein CFIICLFH_1875 [Methylobacterium goesingense]
MKMTVMVQAFVNARARPIPGDRDMPPTRSGALKATAAIKKTPVMTG